MRAAPRLGLLIAAGFGLLALGAGAFEIHARVTPSLYDPPAQYVPPGDVEAARGMREVRAVTRGGLALRGWYAPATAKPYTLLFFHGSGDGLVKAARMTTPFVRSGYGVLLVEFRGYSGEPGTPSEQGLYQDGRAFVRALQSQGVEPKQMVLFGYSLGTGVAVKLATEYPVAGLMLLAPFLSINKITQHEHPWLPVELLVKDSYDNASRMPNVHCPLLIGHGTADKVVPVRQGTALFDLANQPKALKLLGGDGHLNAFADFAKVAIPWLGKLPPSP